MDSLKDMRWRQRFENFEKSYNLLKKYASHEIKTELEQAGMIQFFEMTFELAWKVMKDYLESQGYSVKSPREVIKQAFQNELIDDGHAWIDALANRNLTAHTYNEQLAEKFLVEIKQLYLPAFGQLYERLKEEL